MYEVRHGRYRLTAPLNNRYRLYSLPSVADVGYPKSRSRCRSSITLQEMLAEDERFSSYRFLRLAMVCKDCFSRAPEAWRSMLTGRW